MAENRVEVLLTAKDKASGAINKNTKAMKGMTGASKTLGDSLKTLKGVAVTAFAGWGVSKMATNIVKIGANFKYTMAIVRGVSQATAKEYEALEAIARKMGETTEWSATEAAEALKFLSMAGFKAEKAIKALPGTLDLATAGNIDLGRTADIVTNALTAMRLPVEELTRVSDVFIQTITSSNTNMEMMAESFKYAAPVAAAYGIKIERLSALIGLLGNAGIQGSMAGTQLAMAMIKSKKVFDEYGVSAKNADGSTKDFVDALELLTQTGGDTNEILSIFTMRAGRAALALLGQGVPAIMAYIKELEKAKGATKKLADIIRDTAKIDWKILISVLESVAIDIFYKLEKGLVTFLKNITKAVKESKDIILDLIGVFQSLWGTLIAFPVGVFKHFSDTTKKLKEMEEQAKKTNKALIPPKSNLREFIVFLTNWGRDIIDVFKFILKSIGEIFATLVSDAIATVKIIGSEFYTLGKLMWEALTLQWGNLDETWAGLVGDMSAFNQEIETNWTVMTSNLSSNWDTMIANMKTRLTDAIPDLIPPGEEEAKAPGKAPPAIIPTAVYKQTAEMKKRYAKYYEALEEMEDNADMEAIMRERERLDESSAYHSEKLALQNQFNQEYADMGKTQFDLEREQVERLMGVYEQAGFDKIRIAQLTSDKLAAISQAEQQAKLSIYSDMAGQIAGTFQQIAQAGGKQSKEAFIAYKVFAMAQAGIAGYMAYLNTLASPLLIPPMNIYMANVVAALAAVQIAMIGAAQPPSYDQGGISDKAGIYRTGSIKEAHIPIPSGKIPVKIEESRSSITQIDIVNVFDPILFDQYLASVRGQNAVVNVIGVKSQSVRRVLR